MKTSTEIGSIYRQVGEEKAIELVAKALKEINYNGYLTLECDAYVKSAENIEEKVKNLCLAVKRFDKLIEEQ